MSRPDGPVKVRMTPDAMEAMIVRDHLGRSLTWTWGEPDDEGCYTPTISVAVDDPAAQDMTDGRALRLLQDACTEKRWRYSFEPRYMVDQLGPVGYRMSLWGPRREYGEVDADTIAGVADLAREAIGRAR